MPRNSSGVMTLPTGNPVIPGTLIESDWANRTMQDIATAITGSLPRNGAAPMTGPLVLAGDADLPLQAVPLQQLEEYIAGATSYLPVMNSQRFLATDGQTIFTMTDPNYSVLSDTNVYINGLLQDPSDAYTASGMNIVLSEGAQYLDEVIVEYAIEADAPLSSEYVSFLQSGTGAVLRASQDKMRDSMSVKDFGAIGDGVHDDSAFFAAAAANGSFTIPAGVYLISTNISVINAVEFLPGASLSISAGVTVTLNGPVKADAARTFSGAGTVILGGTGSTVAVPEWWGASHAVNSGAAINKMIAACTANMIEMHFSQDYPIETLVTFAPENNVTSKSYSIFNAAAGAVNGVLITTGNAGIFNLPRIAGFTGYGLRLLGVSLGDVNCHAINNCGDGVQIATINSSAPNTLDTKLTVGVIGGCTNGIHVTADNTANVMQGNETYVNFSVGNLRSLFFDAPGITPQWDSNKFIYQAIDPTQGLGANTRGLISNANDVPRLTFHVESWFGGFATTAKYIEGAFNGADIYLSLIETPTNYGMISVIGTGNILKTRARANKLTLPIVARQAPNQRASFNGGLPLWYDRDKVRVTITGANLLNGGVVNAFIYHLKTDKYSENFRIIPINTSGMVPIVISDESATNANEIWIQLMNMSGVTLNVGTNIDFYFESGF